MSIRVEAKQLQAALRNLVPEVNRFLAAQLAAEVEALIDMAQRDVPVKSGALRDSAFFALISNGNDGGKVVKAVAGYLSEYAPAVHELGDKDAPGWKWFEKAFNEFETGFQARAIAFIQAALAQAVE